jgi:hypothetical protein
MIDATQFATGLRALVFSHCLPEERESLRDVEVAALDPATLEVSGEDLMGVVKFAGATLSILHVRHGSIAVQYLTQVIPLERGTSITVRWSAVSGSEPMLADAPELPRAGVRKCAVSPAPSAAVSTARGEGR